MAWSKLDILNLVFNLLNKSSVNDVANSGEFADSASRAFDLLLPAELSGQSWRFATKVQQLSVLVAAPPISWWRYQLQLPSDYLAAVRIIPHFDFQIYQTLMYCNYNVVQLEYRYQVDPTALPAYFVHYFAIKMGAWFANAVSQDDNLARSLEQRAAFELQKALFTDSQSHPIPAMQNNPIVQSRGNYYSWAGSRYDTWGV